MTHEEAKNWKMPALQQPAELQCGAKEVGTTSMADKHPPVKMPLGGEKSTIDARISSMIHDQPFDGAVK